jgi:cytosine/adenosine deaminase-related metal-dependent hydrolase
MATVDGAIAAGVADRAGSLRAGKQADIVLIRTGALNLAPAVDPVAAVVGGGTARDVDTVLVGGRIVKRHGTLLHRDTGRLIDQLRAAAEHVTA